MTFAVEMSAATDRGRARARNEDALAIEPELRFAIVADGLGGHLAGEVASRMAVDVLATELRTALAPRRAHVLCEADANALLIDAITAANAAVFDASRADASQAGMGTTVVVGLWLAARVVTAHVGDSRLYRLRGAELRQLTHDHSVIQERVDRGAISAEQARFAPARAIVTRALGLDAHVDVDVRCFDAEPADVYLLCSDGLSDMLSDAEIAAVLERTLPDLDRTVNALVDAANDSGGRDNVSVVVAQLTGEEAAR